MSNSAPALLLSLTPLSPESRSFFHSRFGADASFADLTSLRRLSLWAGLTRLRATRVGAVVITGAPHELRLFADYLLVLAFLVPAPVRQRQLPGGEATFLGKTQLVRSALRIAAGLLAGAARLVGAWLRARRLALEPFVPRHLDACARCLYLKPALTFGASVGGSMAHVAGVVNALLRSGVEVCLLSSHELALVEASAEQIVVPPDFLISYPFEMNQLSYQAVFLRAAREQIRMSTPDFIYQRYALNDMSGLLLRRRFRVPLVLEFNGSEVWAQRHWGQPLRLEALAQAIENINLRHADLIVVVSQALVEQAVSLGAVRERVLFHPNGIDPLIFDPARFTDEERRKVRQQLAIPGEVELLTFVGTFGEWHGTDVLARAIRKLIDEDPPWLERHRAHFLFVGDGVLAPKVRATLGETLGAPFVTLAGFRPQAETPGILAASDILLSPHVPNPDGTPFFGSPTKLFEYMAMARLIVASDLDQIGWVLKGWRPGTPPPARSATSEAAILVEPGSLDSLVEGIRQAVEMHPARREGLGSTARRLALESFTWDKNVAAVLAQVRTAARAPLDPPRP